MFDSTHLLGKLGAWIEVQTSPWFCRPLFKCPVCMASFHGGIVGVIIYDFTYTVLPFVVCLAGLNFIINAFMPEYD